MEQTDKAMLCRHFLHDLHGQLVVIRGDVGCGINRSQLMLRRCNLVMLRLGKDSQLPELIIEIFHKGRNPWLYDTEIVIIQLLSLRRLCSEQGPSGKAQIRSGIIHFLCNEEILLLRSNRGDDALCRIISKQTKDTERLLAERFHGPQQRRLLVQCMPAIGTEGGGDTERLSFDKGVGSWVPGRIASGFKCCTQAAGRERGGIRLTLDQLFPGELHDDASIRSR